MTNSRIVSINASVFRFCYDSQQGKQRQRRAIIDRILYANNTFYLVGECLEENIEKQFRVDRITSAVINEITGQPFTMAELQGLFSDSACEIKDLVENKLERISPDKAAKVTTVALKTRNIQLSEDIANRIASFAPKGDGGFQRLIRMLQENLVKSNLSLTEEQVQRVVRYAEKYGKGGYQIIFKAILSSLEQ